MNPATLVALGAANAALAVIAGAFAAHGLEGSISPRLFNAFETGAQYHFYHALGLIIVGLVAARSAPSLPLKVAGWSMLLGIVLFSGSLYALALTATAALGAITPLGGLAFIVAWLALAWHGWRHWT